MMISDFVILSFFFLIDKVMFLNDLREKSKASPLTPTFIVILNLLLITILVISCLIIDYRLSTVADMSLMIMFLGTTCEVSSCSAFQFACLRRGLSRVDHWILEGVSYMLI